MIAMSPKTICAFAALIALCSALTLPTTELSILNNPGPIANISAPSLNDIAIDCNGRQFGSNLNYDSCLDSFSTFQYGGSPLPFTVARRRTGTFTRALPWKWVSGDGRCTFDIVMKGTAPSETTTGEEIARAAWKLMNQCVRDDHNQGGIVSGIGQRKTLGIILRSYTPSSIECATDRKPFSDDKCNDLLHAMPAEISPSRTWGPEGQAGVDNILPYTYQLGGNRCRLSVTGAYGDQDLTDTMNMFQVWTAGVMLAGMCARFDVSGKYEHLGANGRLWVVLDDGPVIPPPGPPGSVGSGLIGNSSLVIDQA